MATCDKCGQPVARTNDALMLEALIQNIPFAVIMYQARHLLPVKGCEGSPSRAQYLEGQPRDPRYPYDANRKIQVCAGYARLQTL